MSLFLWHPSATRNVFRATNSTTKIRKHFIRQPDSLPIVASRSCRIPQPPLSCVTTSFRGQRHSQPKQFPSYSTTTAPRVRSYDSMGGAVDQRTVPPAERITDDLERPALDDRSYRVIKLLNQLEVLLVHDAETDKASGALDVNVGSFSDADDMPGLAHAVEHMLFMGTKKYPQENAYNQYLTAHSGHSNAYTASTSTNYYFEVAAPSSPPNSKTSSASTSQEDLKLEKTESPLYGALDRFAQFFIEPLFLEDTVDRELRSVDSENKKNLQSDNWRLHQLNKTLSNPKHPFCHFSTGSYETLHDEPISRGVKIREEFIKFYQTHYSANRMKLVVLGRESLDELQSWVEELFTPIMNKNLPRYRWDGVSPFTENELKTVVFAKPVFDMRVLDMYFPYPDEEALFESQPGRYLSHLIGHEGPGSILAYLKNKGWANGLGAGPQPLCPGSAFFSISIRLTEEGLKHYQEVTRTIFQYISMLSDSPPQQWIFDELKRMSEVDFRFKQKAPASKTASGLSAVMQRPYPREWLLSGPSLLRKFDPEAIKNGLAHLRPDNFRLTLVSQQYPGNWDMKERWYGTQYKIERIPDNILSELIAAWSSKASERPFELHLPHKNEFIPTKLEVEKKEIPEPLKHPKLIRNDERVRTWYKKDDRFWVPKANLHITLRSPLAAMTPHTAVTSQLYHGLVQDALVEYSYAAEIAGLEYSLLSHSLGLDVTVSGYNDKMAVLLEKVLTIMRDLDVREDRFRIVKERLMRGYKNWEFQQPYHQIGTYSRWLNSDRGWINEQYLAELPHVEAEDIRKFFPQLLHQLHIEVLAHGNLAKEDALTFTHLVQDILRPWKLPPSQWPIRRSLVFQPGANYVYERPLKDPANINHCIEYMLYVGSNQDRELRAKLLLLAQIADEPCFDQLRTKEQLGYVVFSGASIHNTWIGYRILVQSEKNPEYLEDRIENLLSDLGQQIKDMDERTFEKHKISIINKRSERLKNLNQESGRFWNHVLSECYDFEQADYDVVHISPLTKDAMISFYEHYISPTSTHRAKLSVHMLAQNALPTPTAASSPAPSPPPPQEQKEKVFQVLQQFLSSQEVLVDSDQLEKRLADTDTSSGDTKALLKTVTAYLTIDVGVAPDKAKAVIEQGRSFLGSELGSIAMQPFTVTPGELANGVTMYGEPGPTDKLDIVNGQLTATGAVEVVFKRENGRVKIENVHEWKAGLQVSAGPKPVRPLHEFEDLEAKL